jgi:hypothetical protein
MVIRHPFKAALVTVLSLCTHAAVADDQRMVIVRGKDVSGHVIKKLGLPNQDYCWQQCLQEGRCAGTRWGVVEGDTAGICVIMSAPLTYTEPGDLKTFDGKKIQVTASRKEAAAPKGSPL